MTKEVKAAIVGGVALILAAVVGYFAARVLCGTRNA
jgi:hypothetical protein